MKRKLTEVEQLYRKSRYERYDKGDLNIKHLSGHRFANGLLTLLVKLQRISKRQKLIIVNDRREDTGKAIIFSPTHIGGVDIEMVFEGIRVPTWLMLADPRELYRSFSGAMLDLNGVIVFDSDHKKDRHIAKLRSIELLRRGTNLIIFSEGAYNISPNQLVMHPYAGTAEIALEANADIVPIALVRDGKRYYMNIGKNFDPRDYSLEQKYKLTDLLRDNLATLLWEIMEQLPLTRRNTVNDHYYEEVFLKDMFADVGNYTYTIDDVKETLLRPKGIVEPDEVFAFMDVMKPNRENAFLFRLKMKRHGA